VARQWNVFPISDEQGIRFCYDPKEPDGTVRLVFPDNKNATLTSEQVADLGVLLLAMSGRDGGNALDEMLARFGLDRPDFLCPTRTAAILASEVVACFVRVFQEVRKTYEERPEWRKALEENLAQQFDKILHRQ
jgi:hypothetical protein